MRERELEPTNKYTRIFVSDEPGAGGACHYYRIVSHEEGNDVPAAVFASIFFQKGPAKDTGINGCIMEDLLAIVIDRLSSFQAGNFPCLENELALKCTKEALEALYWLYQRTKDKVFPWKPCNK